MKTLLFLTLIISLTGCGGIQRIALSTTADLLKDASLEIETEPNWDTFRGAIEGNIKMLEGLYYLDKENENLLLSLTKGYAALGFGVYDTLFLEEHLKDVDHPVFKSHAISAYSKSVNYGFQYMKLSDVDYEGIIKASRNGDNGIKEYLNSNMSDDEEDVIVVFYTAQSWGGLINLQRTEPLLMTQLALVKGLMDWACEKMPNLYYGSCDIFFGAYEAGRPRTLGGNPKKGKQHFLDVIKRYPSNLLARVTFMQFYLIPQFDEKGYKQQKMELIPAIEDFTNTNLKWDPSKKQDFRNGSYPRLNLLNAIAKKRFETIKNNEVDLF